MQAPLYSGGVLPTMPRDAHRGLWYDRFFNRYKDDWTLDETVGQTAKKGWIDSVVGRAGDGAQLGVAHLRIASLCQALGGEVRVYAANWHFATGLGNPHPVENGFLWHHVLGTPYIAGAAVKGLVRAWVEAWMPFDDETARRDTLFRWFGSEDKDFRSRTQGRQKGYRPPDVPPGIDTKAGDFIFFDALPVAPVPLKCDVMAPHMGKWYEQGDEITDVNTQPECIPADWHDPVPVYFLVADGPKLQFAIAPRTASARAELTAILDALDNALQSLGAGAKTAAGYGLMDRQITAEDGIRQALRQRDAEQERQRLERVRAAEEIKRREAARATMSPIELAIDELLQARTDKSQSEISAVIAAVKQGKWQGADRRVVAAWLKSRMEASPGQWKPQSHARRPEKDKEHQNTLLVLGWLLEGGV